MKIEFFVPGRPQGKGRARSFVKPGGGIGHFTPKNTVEYEKLISWCAKQAMKNYLPLEVPIYLNLDIVFPITPSWPQWKKQLALDGKLIPTVKPDSDNIEKAIKDACNGIVWLDDCYVVKGIKNKRYARSGEREGVSVAVLRVAGYCSQIKDNPNEKQMVIL